MRAIVWMNDVSVGSMIYSVISLTRYFILVIDKRMKAKKYRLQEFQKQLMKWIKFIELPRHYWKPFIAFDKWKPWWDMSCEVRWYKHKGIVYIDEANLSKEK